MLAFPLFTKTDSNVSASVALTDVHSAPERTVNATITLTPRNAADHANWLTITSWQGGGQLIADRLKRVSEGVYRSTQPVPVYGDWKTMVRFHEGRSVAGLPIYAPEDRAIPVEGIAAPAEGASVTRNFMSDHELLQREAKTTDASITYAAYATVLLIALGLLGLLAWGLHRVGTTAGRRRDTPMPAYGHDDAQTPEDVRPPRREEELVHAPSNGASDANHEELPEWARPPREAAGSGAQR
jgi:hypothetical protein